MIEEKACTRCKKILYRDNFGKEKRRKDGLTGWCKPCKANYLHQYNVVNREKTKIRNQNYQLANSDRMKEYYSKAEVREKRKNWCKQNIPYKLSCRLRERTRIILRKICKEKNLGKIHNIIGCNSDAILKHLEQQFKPGMSWNNYGEWHVDHIIPISYFNLDNPEHFKAASHYTNLQPLWAKDNLRKSNKVPLLDEIPDSCIGKKFIIA